VKSSRASSIISTGTAASSASTRSSGVPVVVEGENLVDSVAAIQCHVAGDEHPECAQDREGPDEAHEILRLEPPCC
jgi:hypothetical protein